MPNTPKVTFNFINNNVQQTTPTLGISHVLARTTKGPFNQPDTVFSSYAAFQKVYGEEIVPDNTISNIRKAFELGSKLRVSRVAGANTTYGYAKPLSINADSGVITPTDPNTPDNGSGTYNKGLSYIGLSLVDPNTEKKYDFALRVKTREAGSPVATSDGTGVFFLSLTRSDGPTSKWYLSQYKRFEKVATTKQVEDEEEGLEEVMALAEKTTYSLQLADLINQSVLFSGAIYDSAGENDPSKAFIDATVFADFVSNTPNIELEVEVSGVDTVKTTNDLVNFIRANSGCWGYIGTAEVTGADTTKTTKTTTVTGMTNGQSVAMVISEGNNGGASTVETWKTAFEATKDYVDGYQIICSHIHQHLPEGEGGNDGSFLTVYKAIAEELATMFEEVLYVEVPKETENIEDEVKRYISTIGADKSVAIFAGGIKYYDDHGVLQNCDVLGTVIGLGDAAASNYGPWYSFSGPNRGISYDAVGPVMENVGSPSKIDKLQSLAEWYTNVFVIKDTNTYGKRTMLWNGFTTHPRNDSYKFLSIVRLNLYLKKNLRPILESYLEEPNNWDTWKQIYNNVRKLLDNLVYQNAMSEYTWMGDQDATSYEDLQVNNEADVRQGKYHVILKYKDIVPLQEITMDITIDAATSTVNITE